jgi:putative ABC transport system permease protein
MSTGDDMKRVFRVPADGDAASKDVEKEIELHIHLRAREFEAMGMSPDDARRAAIAAFGDRGAIEDEVKGIRQSTVSKRRRRDWISELHQDLVVGVRVLRRAPSFTFVALLTLAIGIGANTAIFSVLRSVLIRPLPYREPAQLVQVWSDHRARGRAQPEWLTPPDFVEWRDGNRTFTTMAAYQGWGPDLTGTGEPESLSGLLVSGNFFDLLGVKPTLGRLLTMADDDAGAERVIVLSNPFWRRRFGSDSSVVGRRLMLSGFEWTVVGVLPASFRAPVQTTEPDVFRGIRRPGDSRCGRGCVVLRVIGRLRPGVSLATAQTDLAGIATRQAQEFPETNAKVTSWLIPLHEQITGPTKPALLAISVAVGFVLLIGCVNLANLLLVRGASRSREIGVRAALGAGRGRVVRQLLTENALLAAIGGALGLIVGIVGSRVLSVLVPDAVRRVQEIRVDAGVLGFAAAITLLSAAMFGVLPALHAARTGLMTSLRAGRGQTGRHGNLLRSGLVVTQLSLAVVLLVGAGLLLRSFLLMQRVDLGYRSGGVLLTGVRFPPARYPDGAQATAAIEDLLARLRASPAVKSAEITDLPPLAGGDQDITAIPIGEPDRVGRPPSVWYRSISLGYLSTMGMRLVSGRNFAGEDRQGAPLVGIVNEEAAQKFWPGKNPLGRVLATGESPEAPKVTIVGVVASGRHDGANQPYKTELFLPLAQFPVRFMTLVIEPARDVPSVAGVYRQALREVDPLIPVSSLDPIEGLIGSTVELPRLYATLVALFAGAALLLAALGVYGVMAYAVSQRQREIGVRLALGAAPTGIRRMVLGHGGRLALLGLAIGLGAAVMLGELLAKLLFGVSRYDAPTFITVPLVLGAVTLVASWIPASRAMRMDPLTAIRED